MDAADLKKGLEGKELAPTTSEQTPPPDSQGCIRYVPSDDEIEQRPWFRRLRRVAIFAFGLQMLYHAIDPYGEAKGKPCDWYVRYFNYQGWDACLWYYICFSEWCTGQGPISVGSSGKRLYFHTLVNTGWRQVGVAYFLLIVVWLGFLR